MLIKNIKSCFTQLSRKRGIRMYCSSEKVKFMNTIWYMIVRSDDSSIIAEPTKYLKHKTNINGSPNTVKFIAYSLSFYYCYLDELNLSVLDVLEMKKQAQVEHFVNFLKWLKGGNHCENNRIPRNKTCNSYLKSVFGYYEFLHESYENIPSLKALEQRRISCSGKAGVRFQKTINKFPHLLQEENSVGKTIEEDKLIAVLKAQSNPRNKLLILIPAETGLRIGELLGIRFSQDIDYENHTLEVNYRENNVNNARSKNAEIRRVKISDETFDLLLLYISENQELLYKADYLFINLFGNNKGKPMNINSVYSVLKTIEKQTGIKITPHMLRHYFANERRKAGWSLLEISTALGHKHISTTEKYMNISNKEMIEATDEYFKNHHLHSVLDIFDEIVHPVQPQEPNEPK